MGVIKTLFVDTGLMAIITALIGWIFIYKNSRVLQRRSETWSIVKNLSDTLKEIETSSQKFWTPYDNSKKLEAISFQNEIHLLLAETERWMELLKKRLPIDKNYNSLISDLFKDITDDIENIQLHDINKRNRQVHLISKRTIDIKKLIDESYHKKFF
ncbi:hypothetical protein [Ignatzschineria cameli]|uniref:DUF2489 domain-containing protein n=1 Tax=Ignatzschineria cameli TaxID=2182793 RepID=A0A2U2AR21_9GAMM|nr:hypothetical protein [Ignatzschineria cameli]PWD86341.1 hypothetical protein DC077_06270 [Ignatzschineria cameli]PWD89821.1 hypothetical protein DC079_05660 [Ignatzschineria cameli]PWD91471.1 hypothetical protein DC081_05370 [Ignatzschineria cameli]PWD92509.1 hypothetical protein DC078_05655 [Ignatzschineria cameli]